MSWYQRSGGSWNALTPKRREGDQWVTISSGSGGKDDSVDGSMYYTEGPPERSGSTITYDGTNYSSISDALTDLNSGDSLYIDPSNSPYTERIHIDSDSNIANGITIYSDWDISFNSNGIATINQEGAVIQQPSDQNQAMRIEYAVRNPNSGNTDVELVGSYDGLEAGGNETEIEVTDSSPFSIGQQIFIQEETRPYGEPRSGGAVGASETFEFSTIEAINGNILTLDQPLAMPFPNSNQTAVGDANWTMEDIHVHGLKFVSNGGSGDCCVFIGGTYQGWFNDILCEYSGNKPMIYNMLSMYNRFDNIYMDTGSHYGLNNQAGAARTMATQIMGNNHNRYVVRFGPSGQSATRGYVNNIAGRDLSRTVGGVHSGGFFIDYENLTATHTRGIVTRSWNITLDGFTVESGNGDPVIICAQRPKNVTVKNGTIKNPGSTVTWKFRLRDENNSPHGNERIDDVIYENIDIEAYDGRDITEIGYFEIQGDPPVSGPLTFRNITYGGQQLTQSDVESWKGYDSNYVPDLTVE